MAVPSGPQREDREKTEAAEARQASWAITGPLLRCLGPAPPRCLSKKPMKVTRSRNRPQQLKTKDEMTGVSAAGRAEKDGAPPLSLLPGSAAATGSQNILCVRQSLRLKYQWP